MAKAAAIALCVAAALVAAALRFGAPAGEDVRTAGWVPDSPHTVVLRLDGGSAPGELTRLRERLGHAPGNPAVAARYATLALQHYADTGDARFLGFAGGAISHWDDDRSPPAPIWLLRGRILQTQHRFAAAAEELDRLRAAQTGSLEATLLAADAWRRAGDIDKARERCASIALARRADIAALCAADVFLSLGNAEMAMRAAELGMTSATGSSAEFAQWALAVAADAAAAAGRAQRAEAHYRRALALPGAGIALYVAFADLMLDEDRPRAVLGILDGLPPSDAVLLRQAIAAKRLQLPELENYKSRLNENFASARAFGGGRLHLREQAMFQLYVEGSPETALELARENWAVQKGPEDAAILTAAAEAAGFPEASQLVRAWRRQFERDAG